MDREKFYAYLEEADDYQIRQILDAVVNRFQELHPEDELVLVSLPLGEGSEERLRKIAEILEKCRRIK